MVLMSVFTFVGVFALFILTVSTGRQPFSLFKALRVTRQDPWMILGDMLVSSIIGTALAVPIVGPETANQAVAGGLGLSGILTVYTAGTKEQ